MNSKYNLTIMSDSINMLGIQLLTSESQWEKKEMDDIYVLVSREDGTYQCYYSKDDLIERLNQIGSKGFWSSPRGNGYLVVQGGFPHIEFKAPVAPKETAIVHGLD